MANGAGTAGTGAAMETGARTKAMVMTALMGAVICVMGPLSIAIPVSPVPISLVNLAIYFSCYILGMKKGTISLLLYLLIGFIGLPVFAGFTAGAGKLLGPTGGYLVGYIFIALVCGWFFEHGHSRWMELVGMILGTLCCYLFGTLWLAHQAGLDFSAALAAGVIPFIPGDLAKILIAWILAPVLVKRLRAAGVL